MLAFKVFVKNSMKTLLKMDRLILIVGLLVVMQFCSFANGNFVFPVERKFKAPYSSLVAIKDHDSRRRGRFLSSPADLPLGGHGLSNSTGLYYTKLRLGSPAKDFYVQVDTGSDILWVNCIGCTACPKTSGLGLDLTLYDPNDSKTSDLVYCDDDFCTSKHDGPISGCKQDMSCPSYKIVYGDGSTTSGAFIKDYLTFNRINGNLRTVPENGTVIFGCSAKQSGKLSSNSLDGIMGFGEANTSVLSQLAASGKVKRIFSHCLDSINGGGIFSIGEVVAPKFNTTPLVPKMALYNVVLKDIEVDGEAIQLPMDIFHIGNGGATIIDSGTTLAYLPASIYDQLVTKIFARQPGLKLYLDEDEFTCFHYSNNSDDGFPLVKFHFEGLSLTVHPHDYMIFYKDDMWCIGWQRFTPIKGRKDSIILGDLVLNNKLVVYDLQKMAIGWTDYNCSTSIKVKDDGTGSVYKVGAQHISFPPASTVLFSSTSTVLIGRIFTFFLLFIAMLST